MRNILLSCLFALATGSFLFSQESIENSTEGLYWQHSFDLAQKIAKSQKKNLLIYFTGSDWCGPCKMLDSDFFESKRFKEIAKRNFVLYKADTPRNRDLVTDSQKNDNNRLKNKFNISSYPTVIITDKKGKLLGKLKGYNLMRDTTYHFDFIDSVLK